MVYNILNALKVGAMAFVLLFIVNSINAQNLLANGDFEDTNHCSEYNVKCAPEAWFRFPPIELDIYLKDTDLVYEGKKSEMIIVDNRKMPLKFRLYLYSMLLCPLEAGAEYKLSFFLNPVYDKDYKLEVLFTDSEIIDVQRNSFITQSDITYVNEAEFFFINKWIYKEATFIADGDELFINFGNFSSEVHPFDENNVPRGMGQEVVYLIDNVELIKMGASTKADCNQTERKNLLYATDRRHTRDAPAILTLDRPKRKPQQKSEGKTEITHLIPDFAFDFNKSEIKDEYYEALDELVTKLNSLKVKSIEIIGHTDDSGDAIYNQGLSENRAKTIHDYLKEYIHVEYNVSGKGETQPRFPNTSEQNRELNRRVELIIHLVEK